MQTTKLLINKFLENRCTAEEAEQVYHYLYHHPEVLQQYLQQDWEGADAKGTLDKQHAARMLKEIEKYTHSGTVISLRYLPWVAAAAILLIACCVWMFKPATQVTAFPEVALNNTAAKEPAVPEYKWQQQHNATGKVMKISLPDGSIVSLSPSAVVQYRQPFDSGKRDVFLEGEAFFEVVKDKANPFTVYSGSLSTTALGTSFRVTLTPAQVNVKLVTGKVVIRSTKQQLAGWYKDVYLMPGQQMNYNILTSIVKVTEPDNMKQSLAPSASTHSNNQEMVFDNTPVQTVLEKLMQHYKVPITYTQEELNGISFSGTVYYNDSLPVILQIIGRMNSLSVTPVGDGFCVKKAIQE